MRVHNMEFYKILLLLAFLANFFEMLYLLGRHFFRYCIDYSRQSKKAHLSCDNLSQ